MKVTKRFEENGEEVVVIDLSKDFKKFLWRNRFLMWSLSIDRTLTRKEKIKIFFFGRPDSIILGVAERLRIRL